jgi:hypothetical protein
MIYRSCTFLDSYNMFFPLETYVFTIQGNGSVLVLEQLPINKNIPILSRKFYVNTLFVIKFRKNFKYGFWILYKNMWSLTPKDLSWFWR